MKNSSDCSSNIKYEGKLRIYFAFPQAHQYPKMTDKTLLYQKVDTDVMYIVDFYTGLYRCLLLLFL